MPQKTQTNTYTGYDASTLNAIAYGALESLNWTIKYGTDTVIIAYTPRSWNKYDHEINIEASNESLTITSKHIHGEIADLSGRNKKFIEAFFNAFDTAKNTATEENISEWRQKINNLEQSTVKAVEEEAKVAIDIDNAMNLSKSNLFLTYGIMGLCVLVFLIMIFSGVNFMTPTGLDIIRWGGNFKPLTQSGDWWRLITCVFVHIGVIHLLFNMYALYMIGIYLEPMLGKIRFLSASLASGICASLASLWWHENPVASAGASGAIFGLYGVFLALLSTKLIPAAIRNQLLKSIGVFIVFNLVYGMKSGIDNAAHVGGLLSGIVIGYIFYFGWKGNNLVTKKVSLSLLVLAAAAIAAYSYLGKNKIGDQERKEINKFITPGKYSEKYLSTLTTFGEYEAKAVAALYDSTVTEEQVLRNIDEVVLPEWQKAKRLLEGIDVNELSATEHEEINLYQEYTQLRIEEAELIRRQLDDRTLDLSMELNRNQAQLGKLLNKINGSE